MSQNTAVEIRDCSCSADANTTAGKADISGYSTAELIAELEARGYNGYIPILK